MNQTLKRLGALFLVGLTFLVVGCASTNAYISNDGKTLIVPKVVDAGAGREMIVIDACPIDKVNDLKQREQIVNGKAPLPACTGPSEVQTAHGTSLGRDLTTGAVPVVIAAGIQADAAKKAARSSCSGKNCPAVPAPGGPVNVNQQTIINLPCSATGTCGQ
jgi:hypothetical protein